MHTHKIIKQLQKAMNISQCEYLEVIANDEGDRICRTKSPQKAVELMRCYDSDFTIIFRKQEKSPFAWINPFEPDFLIDCSQSIERAFE